LNFSQTKPEKSRRGVGQGGFIAGDEMALAGSSEIDDDGPRPESARERSVWRVLLHPARMVAHVLLRVKAISAGFLGISTIAVAPA
jgi:hypothetical protein